MGEGDDLGKSDHGKAFSPSCEMILMKKDIYLFFWAKGGKFKINIHVLLFILSAFFTESINLYISITRKICRFSKTNYVRRTSPPAYLPPPPPPHSPGLLIPN